MTTDEKLGLIELLNKYNSEEKFIEIINLLRVFKLHSFYWKIKNPHKELKDLYYKLSLEQHGIIEESIIVNKLEQSLNLTVQEIEFIEGNKDFVEILYYHKKYASCINFINQFKDLYIDNKITLYNRSYGQIKFELANDEELSAYLKINEL